MIGVNSSPLGTLWFHDSRVSRLAGPKIDTYIPEELAHIARTYYQGDEYSLWHSRLIHINPKLAALANPDLKGWPSKLQCDHCMAGKFHKHPHSGSRPSPEECIYAPGEYLTCDLFGPLLRSAGGATYVGFYLDLKSRFTYAKLLTKKTGHYHAFREVIQDVRARSGRPLRFFKTDGDGIFTGGEALAIYTEFNIRHIQSAPGDSASNDIAERVIRTLIELTRTNLLHSGAPQNLWGDAVTMVTYVWNNLSICPSHTVPGAMVSRTNLLEGHDRRFDLSILRAFGTKCFFMLTLEKKGGRKLAMGPKAQLGAIIGIEDNMPAYRVYDFNPRGKVRRIPRSQISTVELQFPFRDGSTWTQEEKELPESFIPNMEAKLNPDEFKRYDFSKDEIAQLEESLVSDFDAHSDFSQQPGPPVLSLPQHADGQSPSVDNNLSQDGRNGGDGEGTGMPPLESLDDKKDTDRSENFDLQSKTGPLQPSLSHSPTPNNAPSRDTSLAKASDRVLRERNRVSPLVAQKYVPVTPKRLTTAKKVRNPPPLSPVVESPARSAPERSSMGPEAPPGSALHKEKAALQKSVKLPSEDEKLPFSQENSISLAPKASYKPPGMLGTATGPFGVDYKPVPAVLDPPAPPPSSEFDSPQAVWRQGTVKAALRVTVFDRDDLAYPSIVSYRANAPPLANSVAPKAKLVSNDPSTKPVSIPPPKNRKEALLSPWRDGYYEAECTEMESHATNHTWELIPRHQVPSECTVLRDRWAYDDKLGPGGLAYVRFKARLTAMGCFQREGIDVTDTFACVMSTRTFRTLLQLWNSDPTHSMDHWDVSTAFIHAPLKERVYMKQATGHEVKGKESWVYLLKKALYGTKQAAHAWQQHLKMLLAKCGLLPLIVDPATYVLHDDGAFVLAGTHVDDLFVMLQSKSQETERQTLGLSL